jgi:DNA-binding FadR family transcriptional regulator
VVAEQLFATLLERLLGGEYDAAGKLPPQRDLAAELGVTMTALREALKRLEQMGLIEVRHGEAMWVRDWRRHGGLDVLVHLLLRSGGIDKSVLGDILEARCYMLRELAGLAAERADAEATQRIGALAREFGEAEDAGAAAAVDYAFFTAVADAAANVVFLLILNAIRPIYFEHAHLLPVTARPEELAGLYAAIARAVAARDTEAARAAAWELALRQRERLVG